ncbi:hypothetical protein WN943_029096 [Citrus x changshan-huyou]
MSDDSANQIPPTDEINSMSINSQNNEASSPSTPQMKGCDKCWGRVYTAEVNVKIKEAYCPPKLVEGNPCLEYIKYIIIPGYNKFVVECSEANGGEKTYKSYRDGNLHPGDLKSSLSKAINKIL